MLIAVKCLDYDAPTSYAPPSVSAVINTERIVSAVPTTARGSGPFVKVRFVDGSEMIVVGVPGDLVAAECRQGQ